MNHNDEIHSNKMKILIEKLAAQSSRLKGFCPEEERELIQFVYSDLPSVDEGHFDEVEVKRLVWKYAQRIYRQKKRQTKFFVSIHSKISLKPNEEGLEFEAMQSIPDTTSAACTQSFLIEELDLERDELQITKLLLEGYKKIEIRTRLNLSQRAFDKKMTAIQKKALSKGYQKRNFNH